MNIFLESFMLAVLGLRSFHVITCRQETQRFGTLVRRLGRANERTVDDIWLTFILGQEIYKSTGP